MSAQPPLKIHILAELLDQPMGGGNQFLKALRSELRALDLYAEDPQDATVILFNSFPFENFGKIRELARYRAEGKFVVHRVDGPISIVRGTDKVIDYLINRINGWFADATIFQTQWSRQQCLALGLRPKLWETVVINGSDPTYFHRKPVPRSPSSQTKIRIVATSWSSNWRKGFDIYHFLDQNLDFNRFQFTFIGNSPIAFRNIEKLKPMGSQELGRKLHEFDFYLTASVNDPCSNALIEAISCGLPCLVRDSGGHQEILQHGGLQFSGCEDVLQSIEQMLKNLERFRDNLPSYSIQQSAGQYVTFMERILREAGSSTRSGSMLLSFKAAFLVSISKIWRAQVFLGQALSKRWKAYLGQAPRRLA